MSVAMDGLFALFSTTFVGLDDGFEEGLDAACLEDDASAGDVAAGFVVVDFPLCEDDDTFVVVVPPSSSRMHGERRFGLGGILWLDDQQCDN